MAVSALSLAGAGLVVLLLVVAVVRGFNAGYQRHRGEDIWSEDYDIMEEELKVQLLRELEAAAERPPPGDRKLVHFLDEGDGSGTLSANSSTTVGYAGLQASLPSRAGLYSNRIIPSPVPSDSSMFNGHSIPEYVAIPHWQSPTQQNASHPTSRQVLNHGFPEEEPPLYVNAKQFHRILKRRLARQKLEEKLRGIASGEVSLQKGLREGVGGVYGSMRRQRGADRRSSDGEAVDSFGKEVKSSVF